MQLVWWDSSFSMRAVSKIGSNLVIVTSASIYTFSYYIGHALMMYRYGRGVSSMIFIPFIGAAVVQEKQVRK